MNRLKELQKIELQILKEIDKSEGNIILFIDEIHNLVGARKNRWCNGCK